MLGGAEYLRRRALRVNPIRLAVAVALAIAAFAVLGALEYDGAPLGLFNLDGEGTPPAMFSALIDAAAGVLALVIYDETRRARWLLFGVFLLFMGADDLLTLHERLQLLTGVDWVYLYLPLIAAGAVVWALVLGALRRNHLGSALLLVFGAAAWAGAFRCEKVQWDGPVQVEHYDLLATIEETLEMAGSSLFAFALLLAIRRHAERASAAGDFRPPAAAPRPRPSA